MDLKEAYERIEWQIKHDVENYDKDPTIAGIMDLERIKEALDDLQSYKDKEDKLRELVKENEHTYYTEDEAVEDCVIDGKYILQILNEGSVE